MSFEAPLQLAWMALVVPVVLLYLRYGRRTAHDVSTLAIWQQALAQRTLWSRWRRAVSIIAACVPIVLVALALARPEFTAAKAAPRAIVVILDTTASMNATDVRPSRLGQAKREAARLIGQLGTRETMAILSADSFTHIHCSPTDDRRVLQAALAQVQPTDGTGDLSLAIAKARGMLYRRANSVVVVLSDRPLTAVERDDDDEDLVLKQFGGPANNVAITRLASRRLPADRHTHEVLLEVSNFSDAARDIQVELGISDGQPQSLKFHLPAGGREQRVTPIRIEQAGLLTAQIAAQDALAADNTAHLLLRPRDDQAIVVSTAVANSPTLAAVAGAAPPHTALDRDPSLTIIEGPAPPKLPAHATMVLGPTLDSDCWQVVGELDSPQASTQIEHPLVAGVDLRRVAIERATRLKLPTAAQIIAATAEGDPLLAVVPRKGGDVVVLAFSPQESDLALRGDFPRLIANAVAWLSKSGSSDGVGWTTRDMLVENKPAAGARLVSPFGTATEFADSQPLAAALVDTGVWKLEESGNAAALPVNLLSSSESDLRRATASDLPSVVPAPWLPDVGPLWGWLVGLAAVWVLGQWVFYQRNAID